MRITDTHVYFYDGIYSNWDSAKIIDPITGNVFANSEQAFMWYKAKFFNDDVTAKEILDTPHPAEVKSLGRKIKNFNKNAWDFVSYGIMVYVCYLKFSQNNEIKKQLLETGDKILVEASPYDRIWGIGLGQENDAVLNEHFWKGTNWLGRALMKVRASLRVEANLK